VTTIRAKLKGLTQPVDNDIKGPEGLIAYCARVSNPANQNNPDYTGLLNYCIRNKHWSIFQMCNAVVEVEAPRDITRQFTRHSSLYTLGDPFEAPGFNFDYGGVQEFSQRYSDEIEFTDRDFRRQDTRNRQNSTEDLESSTLTYAKQVQVLIRDTIQDWYKTLRERSVAKECARVILPEGLTMSRLYVNGTVRSWLHYLDVRDDPGVTQWEHVLLAREIRKVLEPAFPAIFKRGD
jgi:thymidylate synthase (FAD)